MNVNQFWYKSESNKHRLVESILNIRFGECGKQEMRQSLEAHTHVQQQHSRRSRLRAFYGLGIVQSLDGLIGSIGGALILCILCNLVSCN